MLGGVVSSRGQKNKKQALLSRKTLTQAGRALRGRYADYYVTATYKLLIIFVLYAVIFIKLSFSLNCLILRLRAAGFQYKQAQHH